MKKIKKYAFLHLLLLLFSFCGVFSKLASNEEFLSQKFIIYYGISLFILGVFAVLWQQVLKVMPLNTAFLNKAITVIWGMVLGSIIFSEVITINMIIGSIIVLSGIFIVVMEHE